MANPSATSHVLFHNIQLENFMTSRTSVLTPLIVLISFVLAYSPVWKQLFSAWSTSDDYSHGFFIVPIIIYILWQKKEQLVAIPKKISFLGLFLFTISLIVYILAYYAEIKTLASLTLVTTLIGCVLYLYGPLILKEVSFPLFFLFFMIPIPGQVYSAITITLQLIVSKISVSMLASVGIPVLRDGNVIHLPAHTFEVVQACSGLRSLVTLLTLATIIAYFTLRSNLLRGLLIACAVPAAVLVNIIRVTLIVAAYYYWGYDLTEGTVHTTFGVVIFILALLIIYMIRGGLLHWDK